MQAAIAKTTIDRKTGKVLSQEIIGYEQVNEDEFYRPLVEVFYKRIFEGGTPQTQAEGRLAGE